jgi:hypothetical protein
MYFVSLLLLEERGIFVNGAKLGHSIQHTTNVEYFQLFIYLIDPLSRKYRRFATRFKKSLQIAMLHCRSVSP